MAKKEKSLMRQLIEERGIKDIAGVQALVKELTAGLIQEAMGAFLNEAALEKPGTLAEFNRLFHVWLDECYQNKPHSALENKMSPEARLAKRQQAD